MGKQQRYSFASNQKINKPPTSQGNHSRTCCETNCHMIPIPLDKKRKAHPWVSA